MKSLKPYAAIKIIQALDSDLVVGLAIWGPPTEPPCHTNDGARVVFFCIAPQLGHANFGECLARMNAGATVTGANLNPRQANKHEGAWRSRYLTLMCK